MKIKSGRKRPVKPFRKGKPLLKISTGIGLLLLKSIIVGTKGEKCLLI
jgi:hypothetical protein